MGAECRLLRKKYKKSVDSFTSNLPVFDALGGPTHPFELSTHAFLIDALEKDGKSDEATKHCIAIGKMRPWDDNQEPRPLYRIEPKYPMNMAKIILDSLKALTIGIGAFVKAHTVIT